MTGPGNSGFVEARPIPSNLLDLYEKTTENVKHYDTLSAPPDTNHATIITLSQLAMRLIYEVESLYSEDDNLKRQYRPDKSSHFKTSFVVFFGDSDVGYPFMTIIPCFKSGEVKVGGEVVDMRSYYNVFGRRQLSISGGGKLGALVISDVIQR